MEGRERTMGRSMNQSTTANTHIEIAAIDLAGTTVHDPGIVEAAVRDATGDAFDRDTFRRTRGGSKIDMLAAMVGTEHAAAAHRRFEDALLDGIRSGALTPLPHADAALRHLKSAGVRIALLTGFSETVRTATLVALTWTELADVALSPDDRLRGRPHPDLLLSAAVQLHASSIGAVAAVGDTANDVHAARRARTGIAAAVLTGAHDRETLRRAGPSHLLDHVGQFAELVQRTNAH